MLVEELDQVPDDVMYEGIVQAHAHLQPVLDLIDKMVSEIGKPKFEYEHHDIDHDLFDKLEAECNDKFEAAMDTDDKTVRDNFDIREIPDNMKAIVTDPDPVNPRLSQGWLDYAQHVGFGTDPARVRSPKDKPKVERAVQYVRGNFWAGEEFTSLEEAQQRATVWCAERAGMRIHGTLQARPAEVFDEQEAACLLPVPDAYDVPVFKTVKDGKFVFLTTVKP